MNTICFLDELRIGEECIPSRPPPVLPVVDGEVVVKYNSYGLTSSRSMGVVVPSCEVSGGRGQGQDSHLGLESTQVQQCQGSSSSTIRRSARLAGVGICHS